MGRRPDSGVTFMDLLCGAGGTSLGLEAAGFELALGVNHWQRALDTHADNFPHAAHDLCDLRSPQAHPSRWGSTHILAASPECPKFSQARGKKRDQLRGQMHLWKPLPPEAEERSRATMWTVPEFAEYHQHDVLFVENVVEVCEWNQLPAWYHALECMGYRWRTLFLNSMFFGVPQSRDRWYVVAWKKGMRAPELEFTPECWCPNCEATVEGRQTWKRPDRKWGRYGRNGQYILTCPRCHREAAPWVVPALTAIDMGLKGTKIGERDEPLEEATMARIRVGVDKYWTPFMLDLLRAAKHRGLEEPMLTETGRQSFGLAWQPPPFIVHERGTHPSQASSWARAIYDPLGAITAGGIHHGLVEGPGRPELVVDGPDGPELALYVKGYGNAEKAGPMSHPLVRPLGTITGQDHHGLLRLPLLTALRNGVRTRSTAEVMHTLVTAPQLGLVTPPPLSPQRPEEWALLASYYRTAVPHPVQDPMGTLTARDRHALVQGEGPVIDLDECYFRMLQPHEHQAGMAIRPDYRIGGNKRERVRQCGQAVTPPVPLAIGERVREVLDVAA